MVTRGYQVGVEKGALYVAGHAVLLYGELQERLLVTVRKNLTFKFQ